MVPDPIEYQKVIEWSFFGMVTLIGSGVLRQIRKLNDGIEELNVKLATFIEKTNNHEKVLERHDERITELERKRR